MDGSQEEPMTFLGGLRINMFKLVDYQSTRQHVYGEAETKTRQGLFMRSLMEGAQLFHNSVSDDSHLKTAVCLKAHCGGITLPRWLNIFRKINERNNIIVRSRNHF